MHTGCGNRACVDPSAGWWACRGCFGAVAAAVDSLIGGAACCRGGMGVAGTGAVVAMLAAGATMLRRCSSRCCCRVRVWVGGGRVVDFGVGVAPWSVVVAAVQVVEVAA